MNWRFWETRDKHLADRGAWFQGSEPPTLWNPGWAVELCSGRSGPRWCATTTVYEVRESGTPGQQYWERLLRVFPRSGVYLDQQPGRPIVETLDLLSAISAGHVVYFPPSGGEIFRPGLLYTVNVVASLLEDNDLALDVVDVQEQLSGGEPRLRRCRRALRAWADNPSDESTQALRDAYYSVSRRTRRTLMGMDSKDNGVRMFLAATDDQTRVLMREMLLRACHDNADDIAD